MSPHFYWLASQISLTYFVQNRLSFRFDSLLKDSSFIKWCHPNEIQVAVLDPHPFPFNQVACLLGSTSKTSLEYQPLSYSTTTTSVSYFHPKTVFTLASLLISHIVTKRSNSTSDQVNALLKILQGLPIHLE